MQRNYTSPNGRVHKQSHQISRLADRRALTRRILRWYSKDGRVLPWRLPAARLTDGQGRAGNITNPYRILVSEVMLQQTQVRRVLMKYPEFLRRFPTIRSLAAAKQRDVVVTWQGMGYNNRAVRLHRLANTLVQRYSGKFPQTYEELLALPGIGRYTANAILSSAFQKDVPIVDVNVQRLLSRVFWRMKTTNDMKPEKEIWTLAESLIPKGKSYNWNQALMDLGATVCTARDPLCESCPVAVMCASRRTMQRTNGSLRKREAMTDGIPNRIFRGRIIEALRHLRGRRQPTQDAIGRTIRPTYSVKHKKWIESLLAGLEKDGLIRRSGTRRWNERRVSLA
jgi:A/G-specific adenine glycosylase